MSVNFTDILSKVRSHSGSTFHSCEPELIELMRQIDVMVEEKRQEWQSENNDLRLQLQRKMEENNRMSAQAQQANHQIGMLQQEVAGFKNIKKSIVERYDDSVNKLKDECESLKKKYHRLQKKTDQYQKQVTTEHQKNENDLYVMNADVESLKILVADHEDRERKHLEELEIFRRKVATTDAQNKSLLDKCQLMQDQLLTYQAQLNRKRETIESLERATASTIASLENKIINYKEKCFQSNISLQRYKSQLGDCKCKDINNNQVSSKIETLENDNVCLRNSISLKDKELQRQNSLLEKLSNQLTESKSERKSDKNDGEYSKDPSYIVKQLELENLQLHERVFQLQEELISSQTTNHNAPQDGDENGSVSSFGYSSTCTEESNGEKVSPTAPLSPASRFVENEKLREKELDGRIQSRIAELDRLLRIT